MTEREASRRFLDELATSLPRHAAVLNGLAAGVEAHDRWRWLELGCSVAAGRGDELSDLDVAVGVEGEVDDADVAAAAELVRSVGPMTDQLVHDLPGRPAHRRIAAELGDGVQIDLVVFPAAGRRGLPPGSIALVDKDGVLATPWIPDALGPPGAASRREWAFLGWWALSDLAKYLARGSLHEAIGRLGEARSLALQLHAAATGVAYPGFGLTSILDEPEPALPTGLTGTYPAGLTSAELQRAGLAVAALLDRTAGDIDLGLADAVRRRLVDVAGPLPPTLEGDRVRLRAVRGEDVSALAAIRAHPAVYEHWRGGDDLVAAVEEDLAEDGSTPYVIEVDGAVRGWIQWAAEEEPDYRHASIDIYLDPAVRGRGLGTEAVRTLARHLCADHGHHRITIDPAAHNAAAIRSYEKVGFRPVGILRRAERGPDGSWHDALLMDLVAEELS